MTKRVQRPWLQFSLRSLLILMLVTASYFAGRMAPQRELEQARAMAVQAQLVSEQAMMAERDARHQLLIAEQARQTAEASMFQERKPAAEAPRENP